MSAVPESPGPSGPMRQACRVVERRKREEWWQRAAPSRQRSSYVDPVGTLGEDTGFDTATGDASTCSRPS